MQLSQFCLCLAAGLAWALTMTPVRDVNPGYFRSSVLVVLAMLVVAGLSGYETLPPVAWVPLGLAGVFAYAASIAWHLQRVSGGFWTLLLLSIAMAASLITVSAATGAEQPFAEAHGASGNAVSTDTFIALLDLSARSLLLGTAMAGMLLGHYYLTAPWMSLRPIRRLTLLIAAAGLIRLVLTLSVQSAGRMDPSLAALPPLEWYFYLGLRWVAGIGGTLLLSGMVWKTLDWRHTQAATGILYVIVILTMLGETTAIALTSGLKGA